MTSNTLSDQEYERAGFYAAELSETDPDRLYDTICRIMFTEKTINTGLNPSDTI